MYIQYGKKNKWVVKKIKFQGERKAYLPNEKLT